MPTSISESVDQGLACLAVLGGTAPQHAVAWVRANYCSAAVETPQQAAFVSSLSPQ
jgi:hypothetical protein